MNSFSRKAVSVGLVFATALWFAGSSLAPLASAAGLAQNQVQSILALLQSFGADQNTINNVQAALTGQAVSGTTGGSSAVSSYTFTRALTVGSKGTDVQALQKFLNAKGYAVAASGAGSPGNESTYFGPATAKALAKFQAANSISPAAGYFGAKTSALVNSMSGVSTPGNGPVVTVPSGSGLVVSVASDNPAAGNIAVGAIAVPMLALNFTAGAQPVTVTGLTVTRSGLSQDADLQNVYLYQGNTRVATNMSISNGKIAFSNGTGLFTVPANSTQEIVVKADIYNNSNAASHIIQLSVAQSSDVGSSAVVSGSFPVSGNALSLVNVSNLATLTFQNTSATTTVNAGQTNNLIGQFTLTAGNNPVKVTSLRFTVTGSLPNQYLQNLKLVNGSTQVGAALPSLNGNVAQFDLSSAPLMLAAGQAATLQLYADVTGGVGYYFQATVQQAGDIQAVDNMYGVGIGVTQPPQNGQSAGIFNVQNLSYVSVQQGGLVVNAASSTSLYLVAGNSNSILGQFTVLASGDNIRLQNLTFTINGSVGASTTQLANVQNVQVLINGAQLGTTQTSLTSSSIPFQNLNYVIPANTTQTLVVQGTVGTGVANGQDLSVSVSLTGQSQSNYVSTGAVTQSSPILQVLANSSNLTASQNGSFGNPVVLAGSSNAQIASFVLQAGQVNPVLLSGVTISVPSSVPSGWLSNLYVTIGGNQVGVAQGSVSGNGVYTFNGSSPITIQPNVSVVVNVYGSLSNGASTTSQIFANLTSVNATAGNNSVSLSNAPSEQSIAVSQGNVLAGVTLDPTSPASSTMGMGVNNNTLAIYRLNGNAGGPVTVTQLTVADAANSGTTTVNSVPNAFNTFSLVYNGQTLNTQQSLTNGSTTFVFGTPITIPQNGYATVSLTGNAVSYNVATSAEATQHSFQVVSYVANLATGASTTNVTALGAAGNNITVYRALLSSIGGGTVSQVSSASATGNNVFALNVGAAAGGNDVYIKTLTLQQSGSVVGATTTIALKFFDSQNTGTPLGTATISSSTAIAVTIGNGTSTWDIPAGTTRTLIGQVTSGSNTVTATNNNGTYQISVTAITWSDGTTQNLSGLPSNVTLPIAGPLLTNLTN